MQGFVIHFKDFKFIVSAWGRHAQSLATEQLDQKDHSGCSEGVEKKREATELVQKQIS